MMKFKEEIKEKGVDYLYTLKNVIDDISNSYAEQLTDYSLISGDNSLQNMSKDEAYAYTQRMKYKNLSNEIRDIIIEKIDNMLCS